MSDRRQRQAVGILIAAFVSLAVLYGVANPIFEAPDEVQHFFYVQYVAQTGALPVQDPERVGLVRQEGSQPPLYYLIGAALTGWIDTSDAGTRTRENPYVNLGVPMAFGNKNAVVHDPTAERFPWRGTTLAVHLLRLLSAVLGALAVAGTWQLAREVAPGRSLAPIVAVSGIALLPQFLFLSSAVSNDVLVAAVSTWAMVLLARSMRAGFILRRSIALGLLTGLAALSKISGLAIPVVVGVALVGECLRRRERSSLGVVLRAALAIGVPALLVGSWWYARNAALYGDPLGLETMLDVAGRRDSFGLPDLLFELEGLRLSFWGVFGWFNVLMPNWAYRLFDALAVLGIAGWVVRAACLARRWRGCRRPASLVGPALLIFALWVGTVIAALIRWTWSTTGSQGRLAFAAVAGLAVLWALGIEVILPDPVRRPVFAGLGSVMAAIAVAAPLLWIAPAYARPPRIEADRLPPTVTRLDVQFGDDLRLLGYDMPLQRVRRGTELPVTLYWRAEETIDRDYTTFVHLFGRDGEPIGQEDTYPAEGAWPTGQWEAGTVVRDEYRVLVEPEAKAPALAAVDVGVYDPGTRRRLEARDGDGHALARVLLAPFKLTTWTPPTYHIDHPAEYRFSDAIRLLGFRLEPPQGPVAGEALKLSLYWRADEAPPEDYTVFVHLVDASGSLIAQHDGAPMGGDYPTSWWDPNETVKDEHEMAVPAGAPPGPCRLFVGLYRPADGTRLSTEGGGDGVTLASLDLREDR